VSTVECEAATDAVTVGRSLRHFRTGAFPSRREVVTLTCLSRLRRLGRRAGAPCASRTVASAQRPAQAPVATGASP